MRPAVEDGASLAWRALEGGSALRTIEDEEELVLRAVPVGKRVEERAERASGNELLPMSAEQPMPSLLSLVCFALRYTRWAWWCVDMAMPGRAAGGAQRARGVDGRRAAGFRMAAAWRTTHAIGPISHKSC